MKTKTIHLLRFALLAVLVLALFNVQAAWAQEEEEKLTLRMSRDFGYSAGGDIQGTFSMKASGPDDLERVQFFIDDQMIGEVNTEPFNLRFVTDNYAQGQHSMLAVGYTTGGAELRSNVITANYVASDEAMKTTGKILIPILAIVVGAMGISFLLTVLPNKGNKDLPLGARRNYSPFGGTICPRCKRPFGMHLFGVNLVVGKLDRCPYCGKWSLARRYPPEALRLAEEMELTAAKGDEVEPGLTEEEKLRKDLDNSRYM